MESAVVTAYNKPVEIVDRPDPSPGPRQVLVEVRACGVCGSDVFLQDGGFGSTLPITPGHEASGVVVAVGSEVHGISVGTPVALYYIDHCGKCELCVQGRVNMCLEIRRMGVDFDGAFAELVTLPATSVIAVEPNDDPVAVAVLTDAVATPYHALVRVAKAQPGETVVVVGIGGLGSNAVQLANLLGCTVIAVSRSEQKRELARDLGAHHTVRGGEGVAERIREICGPRGPEVVIQTVGSATVDRQAFEILGVAGRMVLVGSSLDAFQVRSVEFIWREAQLLGSRGFTPDDIREVIQLYRSGSIVVDHLTQSTRPLAELEAALDDLRAGRVLRSVVSFGNGWGKNART